MLTYVCLYYIFVFGPLTMASVPGFLLKHLLVFTCELYFHESSLQCRSSPSRWWTNAAWFLSLKKRERDLYFFYCKIRSTERRDKKKGLPSTDSVLSGWNGQSWAHLNLGARSFFWISHTGAASQSVRPSSTALPDHKQGALREMEQPGYKPAPVWDLGWYERL